LFVSVTFKAALLTPIASLPNDKLVGDTVTAATPVPLRLTVCGLFVPVSVTVKVAVRDPSVDGVNVTEIVQLFPGARVEGGTGHVLVCV
jgi:hypothetical protein